MKVAGTSLIKFLGFKRKSDILDLETKRTKRECLSSFDSKTAYSVSQEENEMEVDSSDGDSLFIQLNNGDYSLNYDKIPKNNSFIIPEHLKERRDYDIFRGWRYIDFIIYFRDQCYSKYYD